MIHDLFSSKEATNKVFGVLRGIVTNNQDPKNLGRVKVKINDLSEADESNWARLSSVMAGKDRGTVFLPEVGDEVLLAFENGDIDLPYVLGGLWNNEDTPPEKNDDGKNNIRIIKSRSGHIIKFDDTDSAEKITIIDKSEKNLIVINTADDSISIEAGKNIELTAKQGKILIQAKEIELNSEANMKLNSNANIDVTGKLINLN